MNRNFKGVWIPAEIWLNKSLSIVDKALLAEIDSFSTNNLECFASNDHFAEFLGVSVPTITRSIKKLESIGIIKVNLTRERDKKGRVKSNRVIKMMSGAANQNDHQAANQNDECTNARSFNNTISLSNGEKISKDYKPQQEAISRLRMAGVSLDQINNPSTILKFICYYEEGGRISDNWDLLYVNWVINERVRYNRERKQSTSSSLDDAAEEFLNEQ